MDAFLLLLAVGILVLLRALITGTLDFGGGPVRRDRDRTEFWADLALLAASLAALAFGEGVPGAQAGGTTLWMALVLSRWLRTGTAWAGPTPFARVEEPREYWALVAVVALAIAASLVLAIF